MKIAAGIYGADSFAGEVRVNGITRHFRNVRDAETAGIVLVPQELFIADGLSVAENMFMGRLPGRYGFVDDDELRNQTFARLRFFGIDAECAGCGRVRERERQLQRNCPRDDRS